MFQSLRFRLPALFLVGFVLAGLVAAALAFRLFQDYTRKRSLNDLRHEANGIARLYADNASLLLAEPDRPSTKFTSQTLERATGDKLYYAGAPIFPGQETGLPEVKQLDVPHYALVTQGTT